MAEENLDNVTGRLVEALWQLWRRWRQNSHPVRKGKITPEQFWLMKRLKRSGKLTIGELAVGLGITSSSASTAVKRLEKIGMVQRDRQKQDERVVTVELTPVGLETLQRWAEEQRSALAELLSPLTLEERSLLLQLVEKLNRTEN